MRTKMIENKQGNLYDVGWGREGNLNMSHIFTTHFDNSTWNETSLYLNWSHRIIFHKGLKSSI